MFYQFRSEDYLLLILLELRFKIRKVKTIDDMNNVIRKRGKS